LISFLKTAFSSHFEKALLAFGSQEFNPMMGLLESDSSTSDSQYSSSSGTPPVPRKRKKRTNSGLLFPNPEKKQKVEQQTPNQELLKNELKNDEKDAPVQLSPMSSIVLPSTDFIEEKKTNSKFSLNETKKI